MPAGGETETPVKSPPKKRGKDDRVEPEKVAPRRLFTKGNDPDPERQIDNLKKDCVTNVFDFPFVHMLVPNNMVVGYAFYIPFALQDNDALRDQMAKMQESLAALNLSQQKSSEKTPSSTKPKKQTAPNPKVKPASKSSKSKSLDDDDGDDTPDDASKDDDDDDDDEFLSEAAKKQRLRRVCQRKSSGRINVPEEIHEMWKKGGYARDELCKILEESGWDKDPFI